MRNGTAIQSTCWNQVSLPVHSRTSFWTVMFSAIGLLFASSTMAQEVLTETRLGVELATSEQGFPLQDENGESVPTEETMEERYREGKIIHDLNATFVVSGDRIEMIPSDGHEPLFALENLALERVKNEVIRLGGEVSWSIVGEVTEFEETNYILIRRATVSSTVSD